MGYKRDEPRKAVLVFGFVDISPELGETAYDLSSPEEAIINVDHVLEGIEFDDPPTPEEQRVIEICRKARAEGIDSLIVQ